MFHIKLNYATFLQKPLSILVIVATIIYILAFITPIIANKNVKVLLVSQKLLLMHKHIHLNSPF